ncbi:hypothetical protein M8C21_005476 [Ambrosia artemisiifolia]|uniref:Uncharacterized protein n=1 Tax=Ambrosia artemisiifolia TaxID=4212 RepID=A0AAD5CLD0_AMBAR|nr:hypothetical protein M8C21_005476 [Ambrosia artemisiifolia]
MKQMSWMAQLYSDNFGMLSLRSAYDGRSAGTIGLTALNTWKYPIQQKAKHNSSIKRSIMVEVSIKVPLNMLEVEGKVESREHSSTRGCIKIVGNYIDRQFITTLRCSDPYVCGRVPYCNMTNLLHFRKGVEPPKNSLGIFTPTRFTSATFLSKDDHHKFAAGTNSHQVCLYDMSAQRRPVMSFDFHETPIKVVTEDENGNTI